MSICNIQSEARPLGSAASARRLLFVLSFVFFGLFSVGMLSLAPTGAWAAETEEPPVYLIGPGDSLQINVWRDAELSSSVTVRPDGRITIPLIEDLVAAGKTPRELADDIEARLSEYVVDPQVMVTVSGGLGDLSQQIRVLGEAAAPDALAYRSGMTLLDAIIATGGLSRQADGNATVILRKTETGTRQIPVRLADLVRDGDSSANVLLQPGDVIVIPEGFLDGVWRVSYGVSASETVSDNIGQDPSGEREVGLVSRAGPSISISGDTARVSAGFSGNLSGVHQVGGDDEGFSLDPRINGTSTTEVSPDLLFFDLRTSVSRQLLDTRQSTSASGASTENRDFLVTLTASPYLVHRLSDFADAEWRYSFSPVLVDSDNSADAYNHDGSLILSSGDDFSFLGWSWANSVGQQVRSGAADITTANTDFSVSYPLWQGFALIGGIGYEFRDGDTDNDDNFDGVSWRSGFSWQPNPDLSLDATYGHRSNSENLDASLNYRVGAKTSVNAGFSEALQTSQQRVVTNLGQLAINPDTGELINLETGETFTGDLDPFTFDDETTRTRTLRVGASHRSGRDTFNLSGLAGTSDGGSQGDEEFYTARLGWSRPLTQGLNLSSSASYDHSSFDEDDREDDTYQANIGLRYRLASNARAFVSYSLQVRDSSDSNEDFYENAVTLGLSLSF